MAVDGSVDQMMMLRWLWRHSVVAYRSAICARSRAAARATQSAAGPGLSAAAAAPTMASTGSVAIWYRRNGSNKSACVHFDKKTPFFVGYLSNQPTKHVCVAPNIAQGCCTRLVGVAFPFLRQLFNAHETWGCNLQEICASRITAHQNCGCNFRGACASRFISHRSWRCKFQGT